MAAQERRLRSRWGWDNNNKPGLRSGPGHPASPPTAQARDAPLPPSGGCACAVRPAARAAHHGAHRACARPAASAARAPGCEVRGAGAASGSAE